MSLEKTATRETTAAEQHMTTRSSSTGIQLLTASDLPYRTRTGRMQESPTVDCVLAPRPFSGLTDECVVEWVKRFSRYATYKGLKDVQTAALIPLLLQGAAIYWYVVGCCYAIVGRSAETIRAITSNRMEEAFQHLDKEPVGERDS